MAAALYLGFFMLLALVTFAIGVAQSSFGLALALGVLATLLLTAAAIRLVLVIHGPWEANDEM